MKPLYKVTPLPFGSGLCVLIYQVTWLRDLRLVFGASTAASAAVLAIFIGGLGVGGHVPASGREARGRRRQAGSGGRSQRLSGK